MKYCRPSSVTISVILLRSPLPRPPTSPQCQYYHSGTQSKCLKFGLAPRGNWTKVTFPSVSACPKSEEPVANCDETSHIDQQTVWVIMCAFLCGVLLGFLILAIFFCRKTISHKIHGLFRRKANAHNNRNHETISVSPLDSESL